MNSVRKQPGRGLFLAAIGCCLGIVDRAWSEDTAPRREAVQGMTISCPTDGREWETDAMLHTMDELKQLGVNWICIHPYAWIRRDGTVRPASMRRAQHPTRYITRPISEAHRRGLKIMIKPHLGHWGSFSWRGAIEFENETEWERFFDGYQQWIVAMARLSEGADAFVVGTELDRTIRYERKWREIIRLVRATYSGPLTYAANWTDYADVDFWDALDAIGIQAYFPVLSQKVEGVPQRSQLDAGWRDIVAQVRAFGEQQGKDVVFTELGYNLSSDAPYEPWNDRVGGEHAEEIQKLCLAVALQAIEQEPRILGAFLWKWFPGGRTPRNFAKSSPAMREVITANWLRRP